MLDDGFIMLGRLLMTFGSTLSFIKLECEYGSGSLSMRLELIECFPVIEQGNWKIEK